jgi:hypothetical protein
MAKQIWEKMLKSFITRKMYIKTMIKYHFIPSKIGVIIIINIIIIDGEEKWVLFIITGENVKCFSLFGNSSN